MGEKKAKMLEWQYDGLAEIGKIADDLINHAGHIKVWLFYGEMGAGKTTFIKAVCDQLNVNDNVSSPTFALVNEYGTDGGDVVYHFDFYRIKSQYEAADIGLDEYLDSGSYCLIEWPSRIENLLPDEYLKIEIEALSDTKRQLLITRNEKAQAGI